VFSKGGEPVVSKRCKYCGRYFVPDKRVGNRQRSCTRSECKKKRKQEAQKKWLEKNPDYFKGRYKDYVKEWRLRKKKVIQDKIPPSKQLCKLVLYIPGIKKDMIQDKIILERVAGATFVECGYG
jgi:hypothetical protein